MMEKNSSELSNYDDDDPVVLSQEALQALMEFYQEQKVRDDKDAPAENTCNDIKEDWQLSQFWYDDETSRTLASIAISAVKKKGTIGCISCPTLFIKLHELRKGNSSLKDLKLYLFEFDKRFSRYGGEFVPYDFNEPLNGVNGKFAESSFDLVVADPPFLSKGCFEKTCETVKYLKKEKAIFCSGATMGDFLRSSLHLFEHPTFTPRHAKNLGNEFKCYLNFLTDDETSQSIDEPICDKFL